MNSDDELRQLVLYRDLDEDELRQRVFAKAEEGAITCAEKDMAAHLIAACLRADPKERPQSVDELLELAYFSEQQDTASRCFDDIVLSRTGMPDTMNCEL